MNWQRWAALGTVTLVAWAGLLFVENTAVWGLLFGSGFFFGCARCAKRVELLEAKIWQLRQRQQDMTELLSAAADRMWEHNTGEHPTI